MSDQDGKLSGAPVRVGGALEEPPPDPGEPPQPERAEHENLGAPEANRAASAARSLDGPEKQPGTSDAKSPAGSPPPAAEHPGADHGLSHVTPLWVLFSVLGALLALTVATVAVTAIDLGAQGNLLVAMGIATIKAGLVATFFMHLLWDRKFNLILFLSSILFLALFLTISTTDRGEYQRLLDDYVLTNPPAGR